MATLVATKTSVEPAQANSLPTWNSSNRQPRLNKNKGMKIRKPVAAARLTPINALTKNVESSLMANIF
ncbi:hypothetical protein D3C86_20430 [compost metagenome]